MRRIVVGLAALVSCQIALAQGAVDRPDPAGVPTEIGIALILLDVNAVDGAQQRFEANVGMLARWRDPRLAHEGATGAWKPLADVWHPNLIALNRRDASPTLPQIVRVEPDGTVTYRQRLWGDFSARFDLRQFPLDVQRLTIELIAVGFRPGELRFVPIDGVPSGLSAELSLPDYAIGDWRAEPTEYRVYEGAPAVPGFTLALEAERRIGYYVLNVMLPILLIVGMSWCVFSIDPKVAAPKISVATTSMLTLIAHRFVVAGLLPPISYLTRLDAFMLAASVLVFVTLGIAVWSAALAQRDKIDRARALDRRARVIHPVLFLLLFLICFVV